MEKTIFGRKGERGLERNGTEETENVLCSQNTFFIFRLHLQGKIHFSIDSAVHAPLYMRDHSIPGKPKNKRKGES